MRLLILGFSSLCRRRLIPALAGSGAWDVTVATRRGAAVQAIRETGATAVLGFAEGLARRDADLVYVSTDNADHEEWVQAALDAGNHVVVDKPAFLSLQAAEAAVATARRSGRCLVEATVYDRHPQIDTLLELVRARPTAYLRLHAMFIVPAFQLDNFRNRRDRGGGAVNDLGPYAASLMRRIFGAAPRSLAVTKQGAPGELDTGFSLLADFGDRGVFSGQFGFGGEYVNRITVNTDGLMAEIDRAFTIPPHQPGVIRLRERDSMRELETEPCDSFARFMAEVADKLSTRDVLSYPSDLLFDARQVAALHERYTA
jgi:dTDP-3,4-didehydro-2,6-dideoxy-alpha-D-glucose 3-reductase